MVDDFLGENVDQWFAIKLSEMKLLRLGKGIWIPIDGANCGAKKFGSPHKTSFKQNQWNSKWKVMVET